MSDDEFPGFQSPEENWSKLPHQLIEALPNITSQGELMVILYILRHTWGFQEFDQLKKITIDEFMHGRKTKKGKRMDKGVGMSKGAVVRGLQRAEEHGFIETEKDERDKARVKKYYMLKMLSSDIPPVVSQNGTPKLSDAPKRDPDVPKQDPDVPKQDSYGLEMEHRSEKDTLERNNEKETEEKESESFSEKDTIVEAIIEQTETHPDGFDLARITEEKQAEAGNYATPAHAGGADLAAETALSTLYTARGSEPPLSGSNTYRLELEKVSQVLRDNGVTDPDISRLAAQFMCEANEDSPKFVNPHFRTFPSAFSFHLGQAKSYTAPRHQPESALLSQEALQERQAARPPPPEDDAVGQGVKDQLSVRMTRSMWLQFVRPSSFTCADGALLVIAPDAFTRDWLKSRLAQTITRALAGVADGLGEVRFEVSDDN